MELLLLLLLILLFLFFLNISSISLHFENYYSYSDRVRCRNRATGLRRLQGRSHKPYFRLIDIQQSYI